MFTLTAVKTAEDFVPVPAEAGALYGVFYNTQDSPRGAVLICAPDGEERVWAQRSLVHFARMLSARGQAVLRFDYAGQGESPGTYEATSISERLQDIASAAAVLRDRTGGLPLTVLGVRLGGTLALEAAASDPSITRLVLWEPIFDLEGYARHLLRVNVTMQMVIHKKVLRTTEQLMDDIAGGGVVSANGYKLGRGFIGELSTLRPGDRLSTFNGRSLIVALPATKVPESGCELRRRPFLPFWKEPKNDMTTPHAILSESADWIAGTEEGWSK